MKIILKAVMGRISSRSAVVILTVMGLLFAASAYISYEYRTGSEVKRDWVEHTYEVMDASRQLLTTVDEMEAGFRGLVITGAPPYRDEFERQLRNVADRIASLRRLTADNPRQQARVTQLQSLLDARIELLRQAVDAGARGGLVDRLMPKQTGALLPLQAVDRLIEDLIGEERRLLAERSAAADAEDRRAWTTYYGFMAITALFVLLALAMLARAERSIRRAEAQARQSQKMEAVGQLTGGIAHDFNNLLQVILTNLDLGRRRLSEGGSAEEHLKDATRAAEQAATLTAQLLAFARRQPLRPESLRIDRLVGDMANMLRRVLGENIEVEMVGNGGLWQALVDPNQLQNAVLNLAINARDAMPKGGKLTIELANVYLDAAYAGQHAEVKAGQYVMLAVSDTGTGMPPEVVERAFEPFFTTKPEGSGTGLGLSMVFGFVKQSGGHVKIYSESGQGTTVKLYLPRSQKSEAPRQPEGEALLRGKGETVLVVEDDAAVRGGVVTQLAELGYRVLAAADGDAAWAMLAGGEAVDLLLTDVVMPGSLNGRGLADKARQLHADLPVLFTSGYTVNAIVHQGRLDEGVMLLSKPYRLPELTLAIRQALESAPPRAGQPRAAVPVATADRKPAAAPTTPTILLVEDEELLRQVMTEAMDMFGYRAIAVGTAAEALASLEADAGIDLLLTDVRLPDMNGLALAGEAMRRHPGLKVIVATGATLDRRDLPDPSIGLLTKPYRPEQLRAAVAAALQPAPAAFTRD